MEAEMGTKLHSVIPDDPKIAKLIGALKQANVKDEQLQASMATISHLQIEMNPWSPATRRASIKSHYWKVICLPRRL